MPKPDFSRMSPRERALWHYEHGEHPPLSSAVDMERHLGESLQKAFKGRKYDTVTRSSGIVED